MAQIIRKEKKEGYMRLYHQPPGKQKREQTSGSAMKDEARQDR